MRGPSDSRVGLKKTWGRPVELSDFDRATLMRIHGQQNPKTEHQVPTSSDKPPNPVTGHQASRLHEPALSDLELSF